MKHVLWVFFFAFYMMTTGLCQASELPMGTSFIGYKDGSWNVYVVPNDNGLALLVETVSEPRTATFNVKKSVVTYVAADGKIREVNLADGIDRVLLEPSKERAFAQPSYSADGSRLLLVDMKDASSAETELALLDMAKDKVARPITSQPASQFEPRFVSDRQIVYSSVSCSLGCGKIIQEIWLKNLITEDAEQVTLLNAISRQPVASADGKWIYFSSNKAGNYHIWRVSVLGGAPEQITKGDVTDLSPAMAKDNRVCFVRSAPISKILCSIDDGEGWSIYLPEGIENLRNLEISL